MVNKKTKKYGGRNPFNILQRVRNTGSQFGKKITSRLPYFHKRPNNNFSLKTNVAVLNTPLQSVIQVFPLGNYNFTKSGHKLTLKIVPYQLIVKVYLILLHLFLN